MFFEFTNKSLLNIEADAIFLIKGSEDQIKINPKGKKIIIKEKVTTEDKFIIFIDEIIHETQSEYEKIIVPVIGKPFEMQDDIINDWVAGVVRDKQNRFLEFVVNPHQHKLKKIIFQTSKDQYDDLIKKITPLKNWSIERKISFIIDSLELKNNQEAVCIDYHLNPGRFVPCLKEFCNENKIYLEERNVNILKEKYGDSVCTLPEKIADLNKFFGESGLSEMAKFIDDFYPRVFQNVDKDIDEIDDIIWRLNIRMGAGTKLFLYVANFIPERIMNDNKTRFLANKKRVTNMAPEDIEKEVFDHYQKLVNKIQKIKLLNQILDDKSGEHIFPINQLKIFWEYWDENLISKRVFNKKSVFWETIISEKQTPGDIIAKKLGDYYDKSPATIKGYCHQRTKKMSNEA